MNALDPILVPLQGQRLVEASAGTGKTYAIATLFVRLVLGVNAPAPRKVQEILVVTFTRAATEELRGRVRVRLFSALRVLEQLSALRQQDPTRTLADTVLDPADTQLARLLTQVVANGDEHAATQRLRVALACMDEAAIFTLHAFCQRALQEQAFDSREAFDIELVQNDKSRLRQATQDYWRERFYGNRLLASAAAHAFKSPAGLHAQVEPLLSPDLQLLHDGAVAADIAARHLQLVRAWDDESAALRTAITSFDQLHQRSYKPAQVDKAFEQVAAWLTAGILPAPGALKLFGRASLDDNRSAAAKREGRVVQSAALADAVDAFLRAAGGTTSWLWAEAAQAIGERLRASRSAAGVAAFDDLTTRLDDALQDDIHGERLAAALRQRFPIALIDEFQDTDPAQYRVFTKLYPARDPATAMLLIGDPKQAIYSFRGADLHAYLAARAATPADARHTLDTNWRSVTPLVEAVNALFQRRAPAFLLREGLEFQPVEAGGRADGKRLTLAGVAPVPLQFWLLPASPAGALSKPAARALVLRETVAHVGELLARGERAGAPLQPRDIAVLVRTNRQGASVQRALREVGIDSAMGGTDSVFQSNEARALCEVLAAIVEGGSDRALRRALVGPLWRHDAALIASLDDDDQRYEQLLATVQGWRDTWLARGFMPMFRQMLLGTSTPAADASSRSMAAVLLAEPDGERKLTNLLHLGELLQQAARNEPTPEALLRWLKDNLADPDSAQEDQQLRLESDEDLVQILTLHRSKGLEFPVVFLPFLAESSRLTRRRGAPRYHDDRGQRVADLAKGDDALARADFERLAEDLRLLYVGLTRARDYCVVPWGRINQTEASGLAYLLHGPDGADSVSAVETEAKALDPATLGQVLDELAATHPGRIAVRRLAAAGPSAGSMSRRPAAAGPTAARTLQPRLLQVERMTSYSGLWKGQHEDIRDVGPRADAAATLAAGRDEEHTPFNLPGSAELGQVFHELLEHLDYRSTDEVALVQEAQAALIRWAKPTRWAKLVAGMVRTTLAAPLDDTGFTLARLEPHQRRNEVGFWYPLEGVRGDALSEMLPGLGNGVETRGLSFSPIRGLLQGFIDLIFEHAGKYYVADWKTNRLGADANAYDAAGMAREIAKHRYDLQYWLYTVALHRHLGRTLPGYRAETHLGGVYYLFLRGLCTDRTRGPGVWFLPPDPDRILRLDALLRGERA